MSWLESDRWAAAAWLAGILDGEGCINLYKKEHAVQIRITNTSLAMIERAEDVSALLGIRWNIHLRQPNHGLGVLLRHDLYTSDRANVRHLLYTVRPYLTAKYDKANEALEWLWLGDLKREVAQARREAQLTPARRAVLRERAAQRRAARTQVTEPRMIRCSGRHGDNHQHRRYALCAIPLPIRRSQESVMR
jgi:hypothetical protein